ncbi:peptidoglycan-binding domain-containing protein [Desulfovibrio sp.]|uniref:peptidoglycan-binding domain-containing protein n=1 Tax=Desulfovibrio sp. TaxID=885 RepID=UPI0025C3632B|nr:peptidoglycan-binding domain-containing protein [Desulfovibrio sp.]
MSGSNDTPKGFSALSGLASELHGLDAIIIPESRNSTPPLATTASQNQAETASTAGAKPGNASQSIAVSSSTGNEWTGGKWVVIAIAIVLLICLLNSKSNKSPSYSPQTPSPSYSSPQPSPAPPGKPQNAPSTAALEYTKPSSGTNNVLSVTEIRWCIKHSIRIEAMRSGISSNDGIEKFNSIVQDYNSRCGSYQYRKESRSQAEREVEVYRAQIVAEAIREARQMDSRSNQSSSAGQSNNLTRNKGAAQQIKEAQRLLTELGYDPGPVDGGYGRRTADAVKTFQRDIGSVQNGEINEELLILMRKASIAYRSLLGSQPKRQ